MKFPKHTGGLSIEHNLHLSSYVTVEEAFLCGLYYFADFSEADKADCIKEGSVWTVQWYPETPNGFCAVGASTFERALELANSASDDAQKP
ncbi:hypothetical protein [Acetobacter cerevisiae]|uniref:hypothetical protein n=1 Tax=Acetobacter cerevisiae TaxID=178900 RepID=UPI0020A119C3|nr:hypothetical protein [Acetobacter cerevisiae]MCP1270551.1 hypothetical protein [Acetobacter cerevisiae]MCP1278505.1 hypothetical protein [Acetobacter cerevisiae]